MEAQKNELLMKQSDYSRFVYTLLIVSFYFYIASLLSVFIQETQAYVWLMPVTTLCLIAAGWFIFLWKRCQTQLNELES